MTTAKPFASSADLATKEQTLEVLADGVYALTAEGDPNVGAIEGEDFLVCFEALATPVAARDWLAVLRQHTDKPVRYLVLSHYHAVRVLGASAFDAEVIVAHENTRALVAERGLQDWASEFARMPRLAKAAESVPGLTWPTLTFSDKLTIDLGGDRGDLELRYCGRGHTEGDLVAWLPRQRILFAGDLVEAEAALYTGDAFQACHAALVDDYGRWPIFEHCLPFDVSRLWDELSGVERPVIWTAERDREVWDQLQS